MHLDLVWSLPSYQGFSYLLTIVDRFTCWPEVIPITNTMATTVASNFYRGWIACLRLPQDYKTTDRGTQFESAFFAALAQLMDNKCVRTTLYHPAVNGMVEGWHRALKIALHCHEAPNWVDLLPTVLLELRTIYKEEFKASPAKYLYGTTLRLPGEFFL